MVRKTVALVGLVVLALGATACQKIEERQPAPGELEFVVSQNLDSIPLEYGKLVGVTPHPETGHWAALWFQKPDDTIVVVWVNVAEGRILDRALQIPRK